MTAARLSRVPPLELGLTLGDFLIPIRLGERAAIWQRNLLLIVAGTLIVTIGAYISIAVPQAFGNLYLQDTPVPISLQTFSVLFAGALLGARRGAASMSLYVALGLIGVPVFTPYGEAGARAGADRFAMWQDGQLVFGATGGYIIGFILAAAVVGRLAELGWDRRMRGAILAMVVGSLVIYAVGVPWLAAAAHFTLPEAITRGMLPFVPGDIIKLVIAAGLLPVGWRLVARRDHDL